MTTWSFLRVVDYDNQVSAQQLYMAMLEEGGNGRGVGDAVAASVARVLSQDVPDQLEACRHTTVT